MSMTAFAEKGRVYIAIFRSRDILSAEQIYRGPSGRNPEKIGHPYRMYLVVIWWPTSKIRPLTTMSKSSQSEKYRGFLSDPLPLWARSNEHDTRTVKWGTATSVLQWQVGIDVSRFASLEVAAAT